MRMLGCRVGVTSSGPRSYRGGAATAACKSFLFDVWPWVSDSSGRRRLFRIIPDRCGARSHLSEPYLGGQAPGPGTKPGEGQAGLQNAGVLGQLRALCSHQAALPGSLERVCLEHLGALELHSKRALLGSWRCTPWLMAGRPGHNPSWGRSSGHSELKSTSSSVWWLQAGAGGL